MSWSPGVLQKAVDEDGQIVPTGLFASSRETESISTVYFYLFPWFFDYREGRLLMRGVDKTAVYDIHGIYLDENKQPILLCHLNRFEPPDPKPLKGVQLYGWLCTNAEEAHRHPPTVVAQMEE